MYQIKCDEYILYDPRDDEFVLNDPKCTLEVNTVGSASFTIYANHPHYSRMDKMKSVFEISQDGKAIFRGRMTEDSRDFDNIKEVDLEGVMAFLNDSIIRPFAFPEDFLDDADYNAAVENGNVVEFFLGWVLDQHNAQVQHFQRLYLGNVTVSDPNNYITRSSTDYLKSWDVMKTKLFDSGLGGYFCIRYEEDGNYIDYVEDFELTNVQRVTFGENLLDLSTESDASSVCSAIIPLGKKIKEIDTASDDESRLTITSLEDGDITEDLVKSGDTIYSRKAVEQYGWIYAEPKNTTWNDVSVASNLQQKAVEYMATGMQMSNTIELQAIDMHFSDAEIEAFRIYRYIIAESKPHGHEGKYRLTKLDIDIFNPQNTKITLGDTSLSMTDINRGTKQALEEAVAEIKTQSVTQKTDIDEIQHIVLEQSTSLVSTCENIILAATENFVKTSNYSEFKETVEAQLQIMAEQIALKFTALTDQIDNVDGDVQEKFNEITKYFTFDINGITIGQTDSPYKVKIDNDRYSMLVNDVEVLWIANGEVYTPEIEITKKMNVFGYLIKEDENGNVNCEYVGGEM